MPSEMASFGERKRTRSPRTRISPELSVRDWLIEFQAEYMESQDYCWNGLSEIQGWTDLKPGAPLVTSVISVQGYLRGLPSLGHWGEGLGIHNLEFVDWNDLSLSVAVELSQSDIRVALKFDRRRIDEALAAAALNSFDAILRAIAVDESLYMSELLKTLDDAAVQRDSEAASERRRLAAKKLPGKRSARKGIDSE